MDRLVLDTNSLIQSLPIKSKCHDLWVSLFDVRNIFCVSNEILEEYEAMSQIQNMIFPLLQNLYKFSTYAISPVPASSQPGLFL